MQKVQNQAFSAPQPEEHLKPDTLLIFNMKDIFRVFEGVMGTKAFEMLTVDEFGKRMGVSRSTVFAWRAKGYLTEGKIYVRVGKTIRFIWSLESVAALSLKAEFLSTSEDEPVSLHGGKVSAVNLKF
jgi:hypothetical protein